MNLLDEVVTFVGEFESYATPGAVEFYSDAEEAIMIREDPGATTEERYMDGSRSGNMIFSIYCRSSEAETAVEQLEYYIESLDLQEIKLDSVTLTILEPITRPTYVSRSDQNQSIFAAAFRLQYITEA